MVCRLMLRWFALGVLLGAVGCGNGERPGPNPARPDFLRPTARLAIVTDLQGQLEPCGCQSRPLGGIDRLATELGRLRADGTPTLLLLSGDSLFGAGEAHAHDPNAAQQERWRAETLVDVLNRLGVSALNPGSADWNAPERAAETLLKKATGVVLTRGTEGGAEPVAHVLEAGGIKLGTLGVLGNEAREEGTALASVATGVQALKAKGAQVVIVLVSGDRRLANRIAGTGGVDLVVSAGIDTKEANPPVRVGTAHVVTAGRQGEGLLVIDLHRVAEGSFVDASDWSRSRQKDALRSSVEELRNKIAAWERDATVDRSLVAEQKTRLAALEADLTAPATPVTGNHFVANWREIGPEIPRDPAIDAVVNAYDDRVNQHNRVALADVTSPPVPAGAASYVGAAQCASCHQKAFEWWRGHAHGHAYATLQEAHKEFNLSCVGCHVTGYNQPGGAAVVRNEGLTDVGCESCHGPGSLHVEDPDSTPVSVQRVVPENVCVVCHSPEHSDKFDYAKYRARLLVPGHGKPVQTPATTGTP